MTNPLAPYSERAYALLRIVTGALFAFHGAQKMFGLFGAEQPAFGTQIWIGAVIELVCGTAIALGFHASAAAFLASGTMAVAYIQFHWQLQMGAAFFPAVNHGEPAVLYCFVFLYVACRGAGVWSLDALHGASRSTADAQVGKP